MASKEIAAVDLKKYAGEFDLADTTLTTAIRGGKRLFLLMPGQPEYELVFVGKPSAGWVYSVNRLTTGHP